MHRARQHAETRTRERRHRLAHEAARLMAEGGIRDFHQAKLKAAARLGIHDDASLPRNREIEDALREYMLERVKDCLNGFSEAFEHDVELEARLDEEAEKEASRGDAQTDREADA